MKSLQTAAIERVSHAIASEKDAVLKACITAALGRSDWTLDKLRGRLRSIKVVGQERETLYLDETPLLEDHGIDFARDDGNVMRAHWNYRRLV